MHNDKELNRYLLSASMWIVWMIIVISIVQFAYETFILNNNNILQALLDRLPTDIVQNAKSAIESFIVTLSEFFVELLKKFLNR